MVAEHARPSLLNPKTIEAGVDFGTDLSEIFLLLREKPIRTAVEVLDVLTSCAWAGTATASATKEAPQVRRE